MIMKNNIDQVARLLAGRDVSLFGTAMNDAYDKLECVLSGKRVLVVGGAGTIGSQTILQLVGFSVARLDIIDISENYLADLVRYIRNMGDRVRVADIRTSVIDYGSSIMMAFLRSEDRYDYVFNFAAHKHVRGERDPFSLLSMLETNIIKHARFKDAIAVTGGCDRFFSVSTDKASNPVSMMGASKRIMEDLNFDYRTTDAHQCATSARFANVAFSNGSLPKAFFDRLVAHQPIAVPRDTKRYFVTPEESGEICLLSGVLGEDMYVYFPELDPKKELISLEKCATLFLEAHSLEPQFVEDPEEAISLADVPEQGVYPVLLTPLNTGGEKPYEEFVGDDEIASSSNLMALGRLKHNKLGSVGSLVNNLEGILKKAPRLGQKDIYHEIKIELISYVPNFMHKGSELNLDQRL